MITLIKDPVAWNNFVTACTPNTFLHAWEWGQVQKAAGEDVRYLGWFSPSGEGEIEGVALVIVVNARRGRHYLVPHGPLTADPAMFPKFLTELISYLHESAPHDHTVALRIAPLLLNTPDQQQLFKNHHFRPAPLHIHAELTWVLDLNAPAEQLLANMRKTTRHAISKAEQAGITCEIITDPIVALDRFWPLYQQTQQRHRFVVWPRKMVEAQLNFFSATSSIFSVIARLNNEDVAAAILPHFGPTVFYYHGASRKLTSNLPATQLLQWTTIQEAKRRGATQYNFWGIAPANEPNHPFAGITTFKKGFGGREIDYLHAQDLPLTIGYWKLWAVDTYRKLRRGF